LSFLYFASSQFGSSYLCNNSVCLTAVHFWVEKYISEVMLMCLWWLFVNSVSHCVYHHHSSGRLWNPLLHLQPVDIWLWCWPRIPWVSFLLVNLTLFWCQCATSSSLCSVPTVAACGHFTGSRMPVRVNLQNRAISVTSHVGLYAVWISVNDYCSFAVTCGIIVVVVRHDDVVLGADDNDVAALCGRWQRCQPGTATSCRAAPWRHCRIGSADPCDVKLLARPWFNFDMIVQPLLDVSVTGWILILWFGSFAESCGWTSI